MYEKIYLYIYIYIIYCMFFTSIIIMKYIEHDTLRSTHLQLYPGYCLTRIKIADKNRVIRAKI